MSSSVVTEPVKPATRLPLGVYMAAIVVLSGVLAAIIASDSFTAYQLQSNVAVATSLFKRANPAHATAAAPPDWAEKTAKDPQPGYQLPETLPRPPKRLKKPDGTLLVYVGECGGCINVDFKAYAAEAQKRNLELRLLTSAGKEKSERCRDQLHWNASVYSDTANALREPLNTAWVPRSYIVSPDGKLLWLQK